MKRSAFQLDPANAVLNPLEAAAEVIVQTGDGDPIRFQGKNLGKAADMLGFQVAYQWQSVGPESVTVPAGTFDALHVKGSGSATTKILIKKIEMSSQGDWWYSAQVPFGIVKGEGTTTLNKKTQSFTTELKSHGSSGATTQITKAVQDMPEIKLPF
jgi:hypothetical protein